MVYFPRVLEVFEGLKEKSPYTYFELAHTKTTGWMVWICTNSREADPDRKVIAQGQGATVEAASMSALVHMDEERP